MTSEVENVGQKLTFTHKLTTNCNFHMPSLFLSELSPNGTGSWDIKGSQWYIFSLKSQSDEGISGDTKWSYKGFKHGFMAFLEMRPPKHFPPTRPISPTIKLAQCLKDDV